MVVEHGLHKKLAVMEALRHIALDRVCHGNEKMPQNGFVSIQYTYGHVTLGFGFRHLQNLVEVFIAGFTLTACIPKFVYVCLCLKIVAVNTLYCGCGNGS